MDAASDAAFARARAGRASHWSRRRRCACDCASARCGQPLRLESAACPVPVKKQRKYNLARWAVTGRDDLGINAACERIYRGLARAAGRRRGLERALLSVVERFPHPYHREALDGVLRATAQTRKRAGALPSPRRRRARAARRGSDSRATSTSQRRMLTARLDRRRGLAIAVVCSSPAAQTPSLGGLPHGHFDDIALAGRLVHRRLRVRGAGRAQGHRSGMVRTRMSWNERAAIRVAFARIETPKGPIEKTLRFHARSAARRFRPHLSLAETGARAACGSAISRLLPDAFDWTKLSLTTHNGGKDCETFRACGSDGRSWRAGVVPGVVVARPRHDRRLGRDRRRPNALAHRGRPRNGAASGPSDPSPRSAAACSASFVLSALELDDTRKPSPYRDGPAPLPLLRKRRRCRKRLLTLFCNHRPGIEDGCSHGAARCQDLSRRSATMTRPHRRPVTGFARLHPALARPERQVGARHRRHRLLRQAFRQDGDRALQAAPPHHLLAATNSSNTRCSRTFPMEQYPVHALLHRRCARPRPARAGAARCRLCRSMPPR